MQTLESASLAFRELLEHTKGGGYHTVVVG